jgi:Fe2+ transport system protein FeoA
MIRHFRAVRHRMNRRAASQTAAEQPAETLEGGEAELRLAEIPLREMVELVRIDLPAHDMEPLLELGLMPGCQVCPVRRSPFGDPVLRVEGTLIALRREMAHCLCVRRAAATGAN